MRASCTHYDASQTQDVHIVRRGHRGLSWSGRRQPCTTLADGGRRGKRTHTCRAQLVGTYLRPSYVPRPLSSRIKLPFVLGHRHSSSRCATCLRLSIHVHLRCRGNTRRRRDLRVRRLGVGRTRTYSRLENERLRSHRRHRPVHHSWYQGEFTARGEFTSRSVENTPSDETLSNAHNSV